MFNKINYLKWILLLLFTTSIIQAAPGEKSINISPMCSVLAPSSYTVPDRIRGKESRFRASILDNDKNTISPIFKVDAFEKGDFTFVTYTNKLPTFPIMQPSSLNLPTGEIANLSTTAEIRYIIAGGNSANEVCVYSYHLFQIAGQFVRTSLSKVDVKFAKP